MQQRNDIFYEFIEFEYLLTYLQPISKKTISNNLKK